MVKTTEELLAEFQHFDDTRVMLDAAYNRLLDDSIREQIGDAAYHQLFEVVEQLDHLFELAKGLRFRLAQKSLDAA